MSYAPWYRKAPSSGMPGVTSWRYAPMSARRWTRTAVSLPDASAAGSMSWIWPLLHVPFLDRVRRVREGVVNRLRVGHERPRVRRVRAEVVVDDDAVGSGVLEVDDRGQRVVVDDHFVGRVARLVRAVGDDDRDA